MHNMKKTALLTLFALIWAAGMYAQEGRYCYSAKPLTEDFSEIITTPGEVKWYSAWTFDLPLSIYFMPENGADDPAPEVEMDFTCKKGIYEDSILCSLFCRGSGIELDMPHRPALQTGTVDGKFVYYFTAGKKYRDLLLQMGISYNVEVYVKVTFNSKGRLTMAPDDMFSNCMDGAKFMKLGDTIRVKPLDEKRHVIVPYVQWQEDSIRYIWIGDEPCYLVASGNSCDYDPMGGGAEIQDLREMAAGIDTLKYTSEELQYYVSAADNTGGMFYLKCYSEGSGVLRVEQVPMAPPREGATLLVYDKQVLLNAHDTASLFAIPKSWKGDSKFTTPTTHIFRMFISTDPLFQPSSAILSYQFNPSITGHWCGLFGTDLTPLWKATTDNFLYVRFDCSEATTVKPTRWYASDCSMTTKILYPDTVLAISSKEPDIYRFYYPSIAGAEMTFTFDADQACQLLVSDTCKMGTSKTGENVKYARTMSYKNTVKVNEDHIATWADYQDEDGYVYVRFYTEKSGGGKVTITSAAPKEQDPIYPATTLSVVCEGTQVQVLSSIAQHVAILASDETVADEWEAVPNEAHTLELSEGSYTLQGESDKIMLKL